MSNTASYSNRPPQPPRGDTIARFRTYAEAQKAVDYLSDHHFPVQQVTIVGVDLQMVERVTGRLTYTRVAISGLLMGGYFGAFVGLLISIFGGAQGFSWAFAIIIGAAFGLLYMVMSYAFTGGRRDFASTSQIVAGEYRVLCLTEQAPAASRLLGQLAEQGGPVGLQDPPVGPALTSVGPSAPPADSSAGSTAGGAVPAPDEPVTGPTYSEMIERKRVQERDQADRERAERDEAARGRSDGDGER